MTSLIGVTDQVSLQLEPGERVLWQGRPDPQRLLARWDPLLIPFSVAWAGFAVIWTALAVGSSSPGIAVIGLPFVALGLYFVAGRFVVKGRRSRESRYVLTDRRAVVVGPGGGEVALAGRVAQVRPRASGRYLDVVFRTRVTGWTAWQLASVEAYRNTGLDFFIRPQEWILGVPRSLGFYDVPDVAGLRAALAERYPKVSHLT
jgi:hypothetical protein